MSKGWNIHGATNLPEIRDIIKEEEALDPVEYFADRILPPIPVTQPMAKIKVITAGQDRKLVESARASNGGYNRVKWAMGSDYYETSVYGIEADWDNMEALANASIEVDEQAMAGAIVVGIVKTNRDARVSEAVFNTTVFTGVDYYSDETANKWSLKTTIVLDRLTLGQKKLFKRYGLRLQNLDLLCHPDLIAKLADNIASEDGISQTTAVKLMTVAEQEEIVRKRFGLKSVVSLLAAYNDMPFSPDPENPGSSNYTDIFPTTMAMLCVLSDGRKGFGGIGLGWQPVFTKMTDDFEVEQYAEPGTDGQVIRAKEWRGVKVNKNWGFLFNNVM